eukprot:4799756-Amphidinium_carterae.2
MSITSTTVVVATPGSTATTLNWCYLKQHMCVRFDTSTCLIALALEAQRAWILRQKKSHSTCPARIGLRQEVGETALHWASLRGDDVIADMLLSASAEPDLCDQDGKGSTDRNHSPIVLADLDKQTFLADFAPEAFRFIGSASNSELVQLC